MESGRDEYQEASDAAIGWFGETLAVGEWINHTWIGRLGLGELRILDIVGSDASHRLLWQTVPSDDGLQRAGGLNFDTMQELVDGFLEIAKTYRMPVMQFAGPASSVPGFNDAPATMPNPGIAST